MKTKIWKNTVVVILMVFCLFASSTTADDFSRGFGRIKPLDCMLTSNGQLTVTFKNVEYSLNLENVEVYLWEDSRCNITTELPVTVEPEGDFQITAKCPPEGPRTDHYFLDVTIKCRVFIDDNKTLNQTRIETGSIYGPYDLSLREHHTQKKQKEQQDLILKIAFSIILTLIIVIDMFYARKHFTSAPSSVFMLIYLVFFSLIFSITFFNLSYTGFLAVISILLPPILSLLLIVVVLLNLSSLTHKQKMMIMSRGGYMVVMYFILFILLWQMSV